MQNKITILRINSNRLWNRLMELARIGATEKGGVCQVALTDEDQIGRDLFVTWCRTVGLTVSVDQMGNIFARRKGIQDDLLPVLAGSHLDSQPTGGKFDGAYGVLAALEVIETLNDHNLGTAHPLEIVSWTNEEGARFAPAMIASGVWAGAFELAYGLSRADKTGLTIGEELQRIGYAGDVQAHSRSFKAAFEVHIEQGPILEAEQKSVGVVTGVQGIRWYDLIFLGKETHAGPTPMSQRHDPVQVLLPALQRIYALADDYAPHGRITVGDFTADPGVINTVPGRLTIKLDLRNPDATVLTAMDSAVRTIVQEETTDNGVEGQVNEIWYSPPVSFAPECIAAVKQAVAVTGAQAMNIVSGAGHDAVYLSKAGPTSMIFVPCENGLSHNELENASREDLAAGANVLFHAVLEMANTG